MYYHLGDMLYGVNPYPIRIIPCMVVSMSVISAVMKPFKPFLREGKGEPEAFVQMISAETPAQRLFY